MFGKRLKELREKKALSMDRMVVLYNEKYDAKMNKSTLSRYENGLQIPIFTVVANLADFFSVSVDYIAGMSDVSSFNRSDSFSDSNNQELTTEEKAVISAYREHPELQHSVKLLLGVEKIEK